MHYLDMLARLGAGSAHPGGFTATLEQLARYPIPPGSKILEVGCGTGRTACYLAGQNFDVTALDIRPDMLEKAKRRAEKEEVHVNWVLGDANSLPFPDQTFDVLLVESVSNFAGVRSALGEYYRVLKSNGKLYDREIVALKDLTAEINEAIWDFYRIKRLYSEQEWNDALRSVGFTDPEVKDFSIFPENMWDDQINYPDPHQQIDPGTFTDPQIFQLSIRYDDIMLSYRDYFGFGLMIGIKP